MATMIIEGDRTKAASGKTYEVRNPATGEVVDEVPAGGLADVDRAAKAAAKAFTTWSALPANQRREILHKAAHHMLSKVEEIATILTKEQGKTILESRLEARRFGENIGWFADLADKIHGQYVRLPDLTTYGLVVRKPIGVCGAIVPWNFPLTLAANKVAPAIAAGWMLAFTLSLDDLVIASFTTGPGSATLPIRIYSEVRLGVKPEINAICTLVIGLIAVVIVVASLASKLSRSRAEGAAPL